MTEHLENDIMHVLALKNSRPVRQLDTLALLCETLTGDTHKIGPKVWQEAGIGCFNWN